MEPSMWREFKSGIWKGRSKGAKQEGSAGRCSSSLRSKYRCSGCPGSRVVSKILEGWFVERCKEQNSGLAMMDFHDLHTALRRSKACTGNLARIPTNRSSLSVWVVNQCSVEKDETLLVIGRMDSPKGSLLREGQGLQVLKLAIPWIICR
ncbi:transducin/WD40 repeat-like superfamily protein [Striga asiatica]|uniref:Transducin/WD40 repeat-like superfamily protein n=1 Tax=Striga asiatica TaxID=4170 RepID=A0A5A7R2M5_STRAF|nr:transducin/WD40 repeat-like superfamily protein [Striga asiatica]